MEDQTVYCSNLILASLAAILLISPNLIIIVIFKRYPKLLESDSLNSSVNYLTSVNYLKGAGMCLYTRNKIYISIVMAIVLGSGGKALAGICDNMQS